MELWKKLKTADKPIVLYGMGNGADRILDVMEARGIKVSGVFASDGFVRHQQFRGFTVGSYEELKDRFGDMIVLVCFGTHRPEVLANIKRIMKEQEVYAPDVPVAGETIFDEAFVKQHYFEFTKVYEMLSDEQSRLVYKNILRSKLTGEIPPLFECETQPEEAWGLLGLSDEECYLDLGAFTGDTVQRFIDFTGGKYQKITAVEPDLKNFKKLLNNTEDLPNIRCFHGCADENSGERLYAMEGGRKSHVLQRGGIAIPSITVDDLLAGEPVSFIKMDVEGMEAAVLRGAAGSIRKCRPSLQVAAYHRSEDLFALPLLLESIQPGAKLYLRHFSCLPAWDTDFYFKF
ncbi:MAG: FkbM family methyltransferase [Clostridia bacterium]|nr:FkbM family methyltransferase [Clostridia bacterium]